MEYFGQVEVVGGLEGIQIGLVLEDVDVDGTLGQCFIGDDVVGEFGEGNGVALFFQHGLDLVGNHVGKVARCGAEADFPFGFGDGLAAGRGGGCLCAAAAVLSAAGGQGHAQHGGAGEFP